MSPDTREEICAERRRLKAEYQELFEFTAALFFRHDPISINFARNEVIRLPKTRMGNWSLGSNAK